MKILAFPPTHNPTPNRSRVASALREEPMALRGFHELLAQFLKRPSVQSGKALRDSYGRCLDCWNLHGIERAACAATLDARIDKLLARRAAA